MGITQFSSQSVTGHQPSSHWSLDLENLNTGENQYSPATGQPVTSHQTLYQTIVSGTFIQSKIDTEKCGRDWIYSQNLVSSLTQTKFYKGQSQYFPMDNIPPLESDASLLDLSSKGKCSIPMKNIELWGKKSPQTYRDKLACGPFLFCCIRMYAAADNVRASSFKTAGSRS